MLDRYVFLLLLFRLSLPILYHCLIMNKFSWAVGQTDSHADVVTDRQTSQTSNAFESVGFSTSIMLAAYKVAKRSSIAEKRNKEWGPLSAFRFGHHTAPSSSPHVRHRYKQISCSDIIHLGSRLYTPWRDRWMTRNRWQGKKREEILHKKPGGKSAPCRNCKLFFLFFFASPLQSSVLQ